ncbi:hypothetical protein BDN70DRAFT_356308 [Pholiota conissans]|uniref:Zn(2)-C6 fungal-type domain-containing protein n=1 Tax=Pholiota conissans TaxID=109636 RepID=A0A9P6CPC3_9AGAR|nr:hypothetical protein BDN70DRAFT_356308 [Pholiota conissans]
MAFQRALVTDHVAATSSNSSYAREVSRSPLPAADESSTASPVPSAGDGASDKSFSNDQELFVLKPQSLRQRTAQACDKCRERKTKCSGHRPVCTRCTNRGLLCEYTIRESRVRSIMRPRTVPSPNPFQVNYPSGGNGRPTPAVHSRMGLSQTSAYDRSPNPYAMLTLEPPTAPPISSYAPSTSSSSSQLSGLGMRYHRQPPHTKKYLGMSRELQGWDGPPVVQSQPPMNDLLDHQGIVPSSVLTMGTRSMQREKSGLFYDDLERDSPVTNPSLNASMSGMHLEGSAVVSETPSTMPLPDSAYCQYETQVYNQSSPTDILLTIISRSDGTFASSRTGGNISVGSTSISSKGSSSSLPIAREPYDFDNGMASQDFRNTSGYAGWNTLSVPQPPIQNPSVFAPGYGTAIANYISPYTIYDKPGISHAMGGNTLGQHTPSGHAAAAPQLDVLCPAPTLPIGSGKYGTQSGYVPSQEGFPNSGLYDFFTHDSASELHSYSVPPVSDPGNRYEGYKFFK